MQLLTFIFPYPGCEEEDLANRAAASFTIIYFSTLLSYSAVAFLYNVIKLCSLS